MATLIQTTCLLLLIGIVHGWTAHPSTSKQRFLSNHFHDSIDNNSSMLSIFENMNKIMTAMNQRFQRLLGVSSFPLDDMDNWMDNRKQLDAVEPNCTTTNSSSLSPRISLQKNRRKKTRNTQTTTCIKESIIDGKKQLYKEMNVTDEKGILISHSKIYQTISINTNNSTMLTDINGYPNVISY
ncbi:unnamed protein product [Adineta steineri]|uniref:Uncharacterized protein n=1 Tax=Adineta steineri TaxID=433720 RepID=A0A814J9B1_9BILA|nr:unnamed protein product [Adineta steineri]CAF3668311.1 unnamed protein product [Adineta steineri]